jgi:NAD(P)-dependent dehydrogenase (short-subunit alcohol dehydrogenase family)
MNLLKRVVVTGADGNLGRAVTERLSQDFEIVPVDKNVVDLSDFEATKAWANSIGNIDGLVALAGGFSMSDISEIDSAHFSKMFPMNAKTAFSTLSAFGALLNRNSSVVVVGSQSYRGAAHMSAYSAAKAAVVSLAKSASEEWKPNAIRVNAILPDIIDTPQNRQSMPKADFDKWQKPEEVAEVIAFLLSEKSANVNGNEILLGRV